MNDRIVEWPVGCVVQFGPIVADYQGEETVHVIESLTGSSQSDSNVPHDFSTSDEMFACLARELGEVVEVDTIVVNVPVNEVFQVWIVVEEECEAVSSQIYAREMEVMKYLACYDFAIDFHVITLEMLDAVVPSDSSRVIYKR